MRFTRKISRYMQLHSDCCTSPEHPVVNVPLVGVGASHFYLPVAPIDDFQKHWSGEQELFEYHEPLLEIPCTLLGHSRITYHFGPGKL